MTESCPCGAEADVFEFLQPSGAYVLMLRTLSCEACGLVQPLPPLVRPATADDRDLTDVGDILNDLMGDVG